MALSPFRRHQLSTRAHLAGMVAGAVAVAGFAPAMSEEGSAASEYQTQLVQLHEDLRRLSEIQSRDAKVALKGDLIGKYLAWVEGALAAAAEGAPAPQDEIVVTVFIWAIDIRNWALAEQLGQHVITHNLQLPERFHRTPGGLLVSEIADASINEPGSVPHDLLTRLELGTGGSWDMKDETRARWYRAIGESWNRQVAAFDPNVESAPAGGKAMLVDAALKALREAMRLHTAVGVKKLVEQLESAAKKLAAEAGAEGEQGKEN
jgi:hypothetical protein